MKEIDATFKEFTPLVYRLRENHARKKIFHIFKPEFGTQV